jgi:hypothetical protein
MMTTRATATSTAFSVFSVSNMSRPQCYLVLHSDKFA